MPEDCFVATLRLRSSLSLVTPLSAGDSQVKRFPLEIGGWHLLDVFRHAVEGRILSANERAAGMVHKPAELQRADVVDPFRRRARIGDHILAVEVIEIAVVSFVHGFLNSLALRRFYQVKR